MPDGRRWLARLDGASWIIWYAVALHVVWGLMLLSQPAAAWVTAVNGVTRIVPTSAAALLFIVVGAVASAALLRVLPARFSLLAVLPQQALLIMSASAAIQAMARSSFADGVVRPRAFLIADQLPAVLIAVLHTAAILDLHLRVHSDIYSVL